MREAPPAMTGNERVLLLAPEEEEQQKGNMLVKTHSVQPYYLLDCGLQVQRATHTTRFEGLCRYKDSLASSCGPYFTDQLSHSISRPKDEKYEGRPEDDRLAFGIVFTVTVGIGLSGLVRLVKT
jgi:hypothetical protein